MLNKIIKFSVENKLIVAVGVFILLIYGTYEATRLPIDAVPDITNNQVQIITTAPALGATDIERQVTFPIEQSVSNIPNTKEIRSFSRFGLSLITVVFEEEVDIYTARQQIAERLQKVRTEIPDGVSSPELGPVTSGLGEIYQYVVKTKKGYESKYSLTDLRTIQDWLIRRQLIGVKGVADVSSFGGKLKQIEIAINPDKLQACQLSISDVLEIIQKNNQNTGGAYIEKGPNVLYIRSEGLLTQISDLENISVTNKNEEAFFLRDIADIRTGFSTRYGAMCYNDEGEVAGAIVMMLKGSNSAEVIVNIKEKIKEIEKTLPKGIEIEPFLDRSKMVTNAVSTVVTNLIEGALIVIFILVFFLGNFRAGFLVASIIPLSMLFAIILMNIFGVSGNLMSLGALDFGLIVDGAVIIVEAVLHVMHHRNKELTSTESVDNTVKKSASKMMNSAVFGQLIILVVYLPIFSLQGIEGKMFIPMAQTVAFALLGAFILSLTYVPMMSALLLKKVPTKENFSDKLINRVSSAYQKTLAKALLQRKKIIFGVVIGFGLTLFLVTRLGGEFIPTLEEGDFAVETRLLTGTNLSTTVNYTSRAAGIIKNRFPEVEKVVTKIGSGEIPTDPMPMDAADMMVILKPKKEWTSAKTFDELAEKMSKEVEEIPGLSVSFQYPVQMRFNELMTGAKQDVVCKIFGENLDSLSKAANQLGKIISGITGVQDLYIEPIDGIPQLVIKYERTELAKYQLSIEEVNNIVNTALAGKTAGQYFEDEKRFDIVVKLDKTYKTNIESIKNLIITSSTGEQVPLQQIAFVGMKESPNQIQREDTKRRIIVGFNVRNRDVESIVNELQKKVDKSLHLPSGYTINYGGEFENLIQARNRLGIALPIALLMILFLLYLAFKSLKLSFVIYSTIPLSTIGGVLFLYLRDMPFSISAGIGFIALFGVAVLNGIVLVSEFQHLKKSGMTDLNEIILKACKNRLRPVLMTAFVASLGFLPMALSNGAGAEVQRPLATVVIGGLLISTLLTLFVVPIFYQQTHRKMKIEKAPIVTILFVLMNLSLFAQSSISVDSAIQIGLRNAKSVKIQQLQSDYYSTLSKAQSIFNQTSFTGEFGQINSPLNDTKFSIIQVVDLPRFKQLVSEYYSMLSSLSSEQTNLLSYELERSIRENYCEFIFLKCTQQLLKKQDSLYTIYVASTHLRFEKGEIDIVEKNFIDLVYNDIQNQLKSNDLNIRLNQLNLRFLMQSKEEYVFDFSEKQTLSEQYSTLNPQEKILALRLLYAEKQVQLEQAKRLPNLSFAYSNVSFNGPAFNNQVYTSSNRFSSVQVGVNIPLSPKAGQKIVAAKIQVEQVKYENELVQLSFENLLEKTKLEVAAQQEKVDFLKEKIQPEILQSLELLNEKMTKGELNFIDFNQLNSKLLEQQLIFLNEEYQLNKLQIAYKFPLLKL